MPPPSFSVFEENFTPHENLFRLQNLGQVIRADGTASASNNIKLEVSFTLDEVRDYLPPQLLEDFDGGVDVDLSHTQFARVTKALLLQIDKQKHEYRLRKNLEKTILRASGIAGISQLKDLIDESMLQEDPVYEPPADITEDERRFINDFSLTPDQQREYLAGRPIVISKCAIEHYQDTQKRQEFIEGQEMAALKTALNKYVQLMEASQGALGGVIDLNDTGEAQALTFGALLAET